MAAGLIKTGKSAATIKTIRRAEVNTTLGMCLRLKLTTTEGKEFQITLLPDVLQQVLSETAHAFRCGVNIWNEPHNDATTNARYFNRKKQEAQS